VGVDGNQLCGSREPGFRLLSSNQDAVRSHEIGNGRTFGKELWVTQDLKANALFVALEDTRNGLSSPDWDGTLLDDDLVRGGYFGNLTSTQLAVLDICGATRTNTLRFGGSVDGNKDNVGPFNLCVEVGREEEIPSAAFLNDFLETRLVDGEVIRVPAINLLC
jgi:hypothetical protein